MRNEYFRCSYVFGKKANPQVSLGMTIIYCKDKPREVGVSSRRFHSRMVKWQKLTVTGIDCKPISIVHLACSMTCSWKGIREGGGEGAAKSCLPCFQRGHLPTLLSISMVLSSGVSNPQLGGFVTSVILWQMRSPRPNLCDRRTTN